MNEKEYLICGDCKYIFCAEEGRAADKRLAESGSVRCSYCDSENYQSCSYDAKTIQAQLKRQQELIEKCARCGGDLTLIEPFAWWGEEKYCLDCFRKITSKEYKERIKKYISKEEMEHTFREVGIKKW